MEPTTQENTVSTMAEKPAENIYHKDTNIYPMMRTTILAICFIITVCIVLFLIYQNGRSIYESGI